MLVRQSILDARGDNHVSTKMPGDYDAFLVREHGRAYRDAPPCECGDGIEDHEDDGDGPCLACWGDCPKYTPHNPADDAPDEPKDG